MLSQGTTVRLKGNSLDPACILLWIFMRGSQNISELAGINGSDFMKEEELIRML